VLDIAGKPIKQITNQILPSGAHSFTWNGTDHSGRPVKSGTYLVQLQTKQGSTTQAVEIAR
jgi:flagellar hook assembly protein FlgD